MKKEDVEKIMDLSYLLGRSKYKDNVSLIDVYDLSCKIWDEMQKEPEENYEDLVEYFLVDKYQLQRLEFSGNLMKQSMKNHVEKN